MRQSSPMAFADLQIRLSLFITLGSVAVPVHVFLRNWLRRLTILGERH
jgi:hypothetical protein